MEQSFVGVSNIFVLKWPKACFSRNEGYPATKKKRLLCLPALCFKDKGRKNGTETIMFCNNQKFLGALSS